MRRLGLAALAAFASLSFAAPANAGVLDNVQIKAGISGVLPDEKGAPIAVNISDEYAPSLQIEHFFNDRVSTSIAYRF